MITLDVYSNSTLHKQYFKATQTEGRVNNSRVRRLPNASKLVGFDAAVTGELQQLLNIVENGGFVVGER